MTPLLGGLQHALRALLATGADDAMRPARALAECGSLHLVGCDPARGELHTAFLAGAELGTGSSSSLFTAAQALFDRLRRKSTEIAPEQGHRDDEADEVQVGLREIARAFVREPGNIELGVHHDGLLHRLRLTVESEDPLPGDGRSRRSPRRRLVAKHAEIGDPRCGTYWGNASLEELARLQGVGRVTDFDALSIEWPAEESVEDFLAGIRELHHP